MRVSIAIVTRTADCQVGSLAERLVSMTRDEADCEILIVAEDASVAKPSPPVKEGDTSVVRVPPGRGLGYNRNRAIEACDGDVIVFLDDDCWPCDAWLTALLSPFADGTVEAAMGNVRIPHSTFIGDSISALGFPGGGNAGFGVMFNVDEDGFTDHLSTLNCAVRRHVFEVVGGFDESMTAGAEDGELSYRVHAAGLRMKFQPEATVEHRARTSLTEFGRWFFQRGRAARQYSRRAPAGPIIGRRLASYRRILWAHRADPKIVAIVPLLVASVLLQEAGFAREYLSEGRR